MCVCVCVHVDLFEKSIFFPANMTVNIFPIAAAAAVVVVVIVDDKFASVTG